MENLKEITNPSPENLVVTSREVNFNRELVFRAWTEPEHLKNWWGPQGFTNTFNEFDLRPNGYWRFIMHGPDGTEYPNESIFVKIEKPEKVVFDHLSGHLFQVIATFEEIGDKTNVVFKMIFDSAEECGKVRSFVEGANEENFDKLEAELKKMAE
ncbi:SRPBCC family protein [Solitalea sp. MAHUQ-68]|uniref:SRPBCC family protein n=1 Tax=Solitalea agri TaxID=2953739 RepID=A0A9X2F313_9SPHI|nr:SRPBCC family protein [Solitalea agri]MCO4293819.1 SRPBCC family protein [Solitalea agri]